MCWYLSVPPPSRVGVDKPTLKLIDLRVRGAVEHGAEKDTDGKTGLRQARCQKTEFVFQIFAVLAPIFDEWVKVLHEVTDTGFDIAAKVDISNRLARRMLKADIFLENRSA